MLGGVLVHPHMDLVFVADSRNNQIQSFRSNGTAVKRWGSYGENDGQFRHPSGVAILARPQDRVLARSQACNCLFVTDSNNDRIQVFDVEGAFIRKWGSYGRGDGQFMYPSGIAVHPTQNLIYVTDQDNHRVQVFGPDGLFLTKWGTKGSFNGHFDSPNGVVVHPTRDLVFISDDGDGIQAFRSDGTFLFKWGSYGSADSQFSSPKHLTLHSTRELLFVADYGNDRVQVFDTQGNFVCKWGSSKWGSRGRTDGEFIEPSGIAVHPTSDVVYVSDDRRIQAFSLFPDVRKCKILTNLAERKILMNLAERKRKLDF